MFTIRPTTYAEVTEKALHLFTEHWEEVARNKGVMVLKPDEKRYLFLEATGAFFALAAFDGEELVGYSGNFIGAHIHYAGLVCCNNDVLFVSKEHRQSPLGLRLIRETEREAQKRGARLVLWHGKPDTPMANILPKLKYAVQDVIYSREMPASNFQLRGRLDVGQAHIPPAMFDDFTLRQTTSGSPHHATRCIVLRAPAAPLSTDVVFNCIESVDIGANIDRLPAVQSLCAEACRLLRVKELGRVMLVELPAGGRIDRHADEGAYAAHYDRFHLVLTSAHGNTFTNGDETIYMQPGELWKFNHHIEHEVANNSTAPRVHLIIDAVTE